MTPERWKRLQEAIQAALEAPPADRERVLAKLLSDDSGLLSDARSLVRVAEDTGGFLQRPPPFSADASGADASGAESPPLLGRTLGHYRLEEPLGSGGMGDVFRARDLALGRDSAIKVLPRRVRPALRERLLREAEAAAKLQHPAIATFYEAGEDQGEAFIAMEFVRGETLRVRLRKNGALPLEESLALASCILGALGHAHAAGVLHRDIKPENVMVTGSRSGKLLDFGLARSFGVAPPNARTEEALTTDQAVPGTVGYMSPEQVLGEKLDARSDIFQVGIVLYECLTGEAAFGGATPSERVASLFARELDLARLAARGLPAPLAPILSRALARDPARRYPSAMAFLRELAALQEGRVDNELPGILAVLDFVNLSGDPEVSWVGAGMAETLVSDLTRPGELEVVPRARVGKTLATLGPEVADRELAVGLALGCSWVLSGAYQTAGGAVRITANLTEVSTERIVASAKVDGRLKEDIFSLQDRITQLVQSHLRLASKPAAARKPPQVRVYELVTRASAFLAGLKREQLDQAVELLEDAIKLDPGYAPAHASLANAYAFRAIAITSSGDLDAARGAADRALALEPLNAAAHKWKGYALWRQDLWQEALPVLRKAVELAPGDPQANTILGSCCLFFESKPAALPYLQRGVELEPRMGFGWFMLGTAHMALLSIPEARYAFERCRELEGSPQAVSPTAGVAAYLAETLRIEGRLEEAWQLAHEGIQAAEASDHALRDSFRAYGLCVLGRIALQRDDDPTAARAAFGQVRAQLRGRARTRGSGHLMIQALAGLGRAGDAAAFEEGLQLVDNPHSWNFEPFSGCTLDRSLLELARAAQALGRSELAQELLARARDAGSLEPFEA